MRNKIIISVVLLSFVFASTTFGQTAKQIKEKYGQPIEAYSVSERIWMTPEFTAEGQVCAMRLYPKRISAMTNFLYDKMNDWELKEVLNQLAPLETRGKPTPFFGLRQIGGGRINTIYNYEKIGISFLGSFSQYFDPIDKEKSDEIKTKTIKFDIKTPKNAELPKEMDVPSGVEIVTLAWNERTCAKKITAQSNKLLDGRAEQLIFYDLR